MARYTYQMGVSTEMRVVGNHREDENGRVNLASMRL